MLSLPFTQEQFFAVFAAYNDAIWPAQILLVGLAIGCMFALTQRMYRTAFVVLAVMWAWVAVAYHLAFFLAINPAAILFAVLFLMGSAAFLFQPAGRPERKRVVPCATAIGFGLMLFGLVGYPVIGWLAGHRYPAFPTFGLPCPTTIFTFGVLLAALPVASAWAFAVPLVWAVIGTVAAVQLGVVQDYALLAAAAVSTAVLVHSRVAGRAHT